MPEVVVLKEYCKSCGLCIDICPKKILQIGTVANQKSYYTVEVIDQSKCIGCTLCATMCPDLALEIYK